MLEIFLFGTPRVLKDGQPLTIKRRRVRSLLFYLASQGKPQARTVIATLFWGEFSENKASYNLSDTVSKLRKDLGDAKNAVITQNETISLDPQNVRIDYIEYRQLLQETCGPDLRLPAPERMTSTHYENMRKMVSLWGEQEFFNGYHLSNSDELESWRTRIASQISVQMASILERLASYDDKNGQLENVIQWLEMLVRLEEYNEKRQVELIEAYLKAGKQAQARQYYEKAKLFWEVETGGDPPEDLLALEKRVYQPKNNLRADLQHCWPVKASAQIPFVGHQTQLELLSRAWRMGNAILVLGEAGLGKTRLVQETYQRIQPTPRLLIGSCNLLHSNQPFSPWVSMLRQGVPEDAWQKMDKVWLQALTLLLPELANLRNDIHPFSEKPEVSQAVLVEAIHKILNLLAKEESVFIFIDDLQWADEASLAVISHLITHQFFAPGRVTLVMAARIEERNPLLDRLLATSSATQIRQLHLSNLGATDINEITGFMLGQQPSDCFIEKLENDTGGNPLLLIEILQSLLDTGLPENLEEIETLPLPQSVHESIQLRLATIYPDAREVLNTAALLGSQFTLDVIERATHFIPEIVLRTIDELERARFLQPIPGEVPIYGFPHEKIRESILIDIGNAKRRLLHQKIALALEELYREQTAPQAATLAYHYEKAGNLAKAFQYWTLAGKHAHRLASIHESMDAFERAERLIPRAPGLSEQDLHNLYSTWNDMLFQGDNPAILKRVNNALLALGQERQSPLLIGTALSGMSDAYMAENNFETALKSVQDGLEYVRQSGNQYEIARTLNRIGVYLYMLSQMPESQPYFEQSLEINKDSTDPLMVLQRCDTHYQLAITAALSGNPTKALDYAQKTLNDAILAYHPYGQVLAYSVMGLSHYLLSDYSEGRKACQKGMEFEHIKAWRMLGYISSYYSMNAAEMGHLTEAWHYGQKAIQIGREHGHGEVAGLGYKAIGDLYLRLGAYPQAIQSYQQGLDAAGSHFVALENMHRLGYLLYRQGKTALGKDLLQRALDISAGGNLWSIHFLASVHDLDILYDEKNEEKLQARILEIRAETTARMGLDTTKITATWLEIVRAYEAQQFQTVLELCGQLVPWYRQNHVVWRELECLQSLIDAKKALGQDSQPEVERMQELINWVDENLGEAPLGAIWQTCKQKLKPI